MFNQFDDLERRALRPGNVHSADGREDLLRPVLVRHTAEQHIKEDKYALKWTRLSCMRLTANAARRQLHDGYRCINIRNDGSLPRPNG